MSALWLFCGSTIDTIGEYKPPASTPPLPTQPSAVDATTNYHQLSAENVIIAGAQRMLAETPNVDALLHDGVWLIEVGLTSVALLLIAVVLCRFALAHDCWTMRSAKPVRIPLNLARQKAERSTKRKGE
jgi:uncharacterized membrane protein